MNFIRIFLTLSLLVLPGFSAAAQDTPERERKSAANERFLVIVETSSAMKARAENAQRIVGSVIANGLKGQMHSGNTIGLWTYNDKLITGIVPLQLWTPENKQRVAQTLVQALQKQAYERSPRLSTAWDAASNIVAQSDHITLLLVTSGSEPVRGTPFDKEIAEAFQKNANTQREKNMPFLTILRAAKGRFVTFAVNMPPWPLEVPEYPDEFKPLVPPPPAPKTVTETPPAPTPRRPDRNALSATNVIYLVGSNVNPPTATASEVPAPTPPVEVEPVPPATETPPPTPPPSTNEAAIITTNPPAPAATIEPPAPTDVAPPSEPRPAFLIPALALGIAALLGVLFLLIALLRRSRQSGGESLITHSMNRSSRND